MILPVVRYGDPVLRRRGSRIATVDENIRNLVRDMFDTMYEAKGVGLAAQQVGHALQLAIIDVRGIKDRPSQLWMNGVEVDVAQFMPIALINPVIKTAGAPVAGPEGCLSFPEIYADVMRPPEVDVTAWNDAGETVSFRAGGLLSRAIQHEVDHLNGILFIDRMSAAELGEVKPDIESLMERTKKVLAK